MGEPLLLIPGPVPLHPRVREEMAKPALPHYGDMWVRAYTEVLRLLKYTWEAPRARMFPVAGPGHAGLESLCHTFLRRGDRAVIIDNGFFGNRMQEVLGAHGVKTAVVKSEWGQGPDFKGLRTALRKPTKAVAYVHNETSTGVTNPLEEVVELAHAKDAFLFVDAVSSLGGLPLPFDDLGIDAGFSASQKCLAGPAGISPVAVATSVWESVEPSSVVGWYFNLFTWDRYEREWGEWHPSPTTISSNIFYGVHRALQLVKEEGLEARIARHARAAERLRAGLVDLGFRVIAPEDLASNTVTCVAPPAGQDPATIVRRLREEHSIFLSGGLGPLRGKTLRIGTMATQAEPTVIDTLLEALEKIL